VSIDSEIDTISQNYRFAERFNLLAKVILFGVSTYYLAKCKPFGESLYFFAKVISYSGKMGGEECVLRQIKLFFTTN